MSLHLEWQGVNYTVPPTEPPQDRRIETLHPIFWTQLSAWLKAAQPFTPHQIRISETRRTLDRQIYLLASGRVLPGPVKSWTISSRHRFGLAADIYLLNRTTGRAEWDGKLYDALYAAAPPTLYNLTPIKQEKVHLELLNADEVIANAAELGVWQA